MERVLLTVRLPHTCCILSLSSFCPFVVLYRLGGGHVCSALAVRLRVVSPWPGFYIPFSCASRANPSSMNFLSNISSDIALVRGRYGCRPGAFFMYFGCRYLSLLSMIMLLVWFDVYSAAPIDVSFFVWIMYIYFTPKPRIRLSARYVMSYDRCTLRAERAGYRPPLLSRLLSHTVSSSSECKPLFPTSVLVSSLMSPKMCLVSPNLFLSCS